MMNMGRRPVLRVAAVAKHLHENGEGMAALVLSAEDPAGAAKMLATRGLNPNLDGPFGPEVTVFGTRIVIAPKNSVGPSSSKL